MNKKILMLTMFCLLGVRGASGMIAEALEKRILHNLFIKEVKNRYALADGNHEITYLKSAYPELFEKDGLLENDANVLRLLQIRIEGLMSPNGANLFPLNIHSAIIILELECASGDLLERKRLIDVKKQELLHSWYNDIEWVLSQCNVALFKDYFEKEVKDPYYAIFSSIDYRRPLFAELCNRLVKSDLPKETNYFAEVLRYLFKQGADSNRKFKTLYHRKMDEMTPLESICCQKRTEKHVLLAGILVKELDTIVTQRSLEFAQEEDARQEANTGWETSDSQTVRLLKKAYEQQQKSLKEVTSKKDPIEDDKKN